MKREHTMNQRGGSIYEKNYDEEKLGNDDEVTDTVVI